MFILTVEDELLISEYLRAILEGGGHRVIATFDADEAIEALQRIDRRCDALRLTPMSRHIAAALVKLRGDADSEPASRHTGARALCSYHIGCSERSADDTASTIQRGARGSPQMAGPLALHSQPLHDLRTGCKAGRITRAAMA
jgi:hypothetical protein